MDESVESQKDWWERRFKSYKESGKRDAENGVYQPPYPASEYGEDPENDDCNAAYKTGFIARRQELGDDFKWA
jgi:hypothetical protein